MGRRDVMCLTFHDVILSVIMLHHCDTYSLFSRVEKITSTETNLAELGEGSVLPMKKLHLV